LTGCAPILRLGPLGREPLQERSIGLLPVIFGQTSSPLPLTNSLACTEARGTSPL
jgi:hypothetical protein